MFTTFFSIQQSKVISLKSKNSGHRMENGYWQRWVLEITLVILLHCQYQKYQKLSQPEKNKLKIQSKRMLGRIKYTHWLADHNKVTQ